MRALLVSFLLFSSFTFAAPETVSLDMKVEVDGHLMTSSQANLELGRKVTIIQKVVDSSTSYSIDVTPTKDADDVVTMKFAIREISNGQSTLVSEPRVSAMSGESATVEQKSQDGRSMKVTVTGTL